VTDALPTPAIRLEVNDTVATVTISRPERRNALNHAALELLDAAVHAAVVQGARVLVITGSDGHFCAGADLSELEDVTFANRLEEVLLHLAGLPITTIAAIEGSCMGLGMQLAVACDLRVVADGAKFAVPVAKLGLMVNHWTLTRVARFFGEGAARQMVLTGSVLTAEDAWRLGFAQQQGGLDTAYALARQAAVLAPLSQAGSKLGFDVEPGDSDGLGRYEEAFARAWASQDLIEGQRAFTERRTPRFAGQ